MVSRTYLRRSAVILALAAAISGSAAAQQGAPSRPESDLIMVHYQGRAGAIIVQRPGEGKTRTLLAFAGDGGSLQLEPLRGSASMYTVTSKDDVEIYVDGRGELTITDSKGAPATLPPADVRGVGISADDPRFAAAGQTAPSAAAALQRRAENLSQPGRRVTGTNTFDSSRFEPPREIEKAPDGSRQFSLRIKMQEGIVSDITVKPIESQQTLEHPSIFFLSYPAPSARITTYTVLPPESGGILTVVTSDLAEAPAGPALPQNSPLTAAGPYISDGYPVHADFLNNSQYIYYLSLGDGAGKRVIQVFPRLNDSRSEEPGVVKAGRVIGALGGNPNAQYALPNMNYAEVREGGKKNGPHAFVDWQSVTSTSPTYFKLVRRSQKADGPWEVQVSKEPFPLFNPKKH